MNLEELMEAWRLQDTSSLRGVNEPILLQSMRQDERKAKLERRLERVATYLGCVSVILVMAFMMAVRVAFDGDVSLVSWDVAGPVIAMAAILFWSVAKHVSFREQARLERAVGTSLRDELRRRIAQVDYQMRTIDSLWSHLLTGLLVMVFPVAVLFPSLRAFERLFGNAWIFPVVVIAGAAAVIALTAWTQRIRVETELAPQKRRLEEMLKEFDGQ